MAKKARRTRKRYTDEQRQHILETARKEGLTAAAVQKRFNVTPVTYYSWRKKTGAASHRRGRPPGVRTAAANGNLTAQVRQEVQQKVRAIIPEIVRSEVSAYLDGVLTGVGGRRRRRRRARG